ncbi:MAG: hypothetical protein IT373_25470 [Polyangiaceae bacterium]|nr:hypothetical protein [Polyangiaceae bacterium]
MPISLAALGTRRVIGATMRIFTTLSLILLAATACTKKPATSPTPTSTASATAATEPKPAAEGDRCDALGEHMTALAKANMTEGDIKAQGGEEGLAEMGKKRADECRREAWPAPMVECLLAVKKLDDKEFEACDGAGK